MGDRAWRRRRPQRSYHTGVTLSDAPSDRRDAPQQSVDNAASRMMASTTSVTEARSRITRGERDLLSDRCGRCRGVTQ